MLLNALRDILPPLPVLGTSKTWPLNLNCNDSPERGLAQRLRKGSGKGKGVNNGKGWRGKSWEGNRESRTAKWWWRRKNFVECRVYRKGYLRYRFGIPSEEVVRNGVNVRICLIASRVTARHGYFCTYVPVRARTRLVNCSVSCCDVCPLIVALKCLFRRYLSDIQSFHVHDCFLLCTSQLEPCCALYHTTFLMISSEVTPKELRKNSEGIVSYYNMTGGTCKWQIFL